ncbi:MAG: hypothetical protein H0V47_11485 [Chloroflexia bacterium]|nr:hypothetical protein [Chloroflexia bacterium]
MTAPSKLNAKLATLMGIVASADAAPTQQAREVFAHLSEQVDTQLNHLTDLLKEDVPGINKLVREADLPALIVKKS